MLERLELLSLLLVTAGVEVWAEQTEMGEMYLNARLPGSRLGVGVWVRDGAVVVPIGGVTDLDLGRDLREAAAGVAALCSPVGMAAALDKALDAGV